MALLMRNGLAVWMCSASADTSHSAVAATPEFDGGPEPAVEQALVNIVAAMALSFTRGRSLHEH